MGVTREEVEIYLSEVFESIHAGRYQIAIRPKNQELYIDYVFGDNDAKSVLLSLTPEDFSDAVQNEHQNHPEEVLFIFGKDVMLIPRYDGADEKNVSLYIKINKLENKYLFVISLHKQEYPLRYRFK